MSPRERHQNEADRIAERKHRQARKAARRALQRAQKIPLEEKT
jgi:hypothetical protein